MAVTPGGNFYIESSDLVANYPATSLAIANRLDKYALNPYTDATERDFLIQFPVQGQLAQTLDDNKAWKYDGTAWAPFSSAGNAVFAEAATGTYSTGGFDYKYWVFTGTSTLTCTTDGVCDVFAIGGGGSGSGGGGFGTGGGGGGGGGWLECEALPVEGTVRILVGAGGVPSVTSTQPTYGMGYATLVTSDNDVSAVGLGGGAGGTYALDGSPGGNGGGAGPDQSVVDHSGGSALLPVGYAGGNSTGSVNRPAGGGGGAGTVGANTSGSTAGAGGAGKNSSYNNNIPTTYGGGGGGGAYSAGGGTAAAGGSGGGGNGSNTTTGTAGTANLGAGGGGGQSGGGNGGSGFVVVRVKY